MRKFLFGALCAAGFALSAAPVPDDGAKAVLKKYAEAGKNYAPRTGRTAIFARSQIKYGLQRSDYLQRWTDRPLWQDTGLRKFDDGSFINPEAWKIMHKAIQDYGIDGFAFFPATKNRPYLFKKAGTPGYSMSILPEFIKNQPLEKVTPLVDMMLVCPQVYRWNGKFLITTYSGTDDPAYWVKLKKDLTAKYGDKFLFLPMHNLPKALITGNRVLTAGGVEKLADSIRKWLRCVDGYYYNYPALNEYRYFDDAFTRDVMIPLLQGVLSEPEFKDKLLAWGTKCGHENFYVKGSYTYNCGGTSMLRGSVGAAVDAKADIVNLVEWDEENENTHFRPTLANGLSTQRIMRYFSGVAQGKLLPPVAGDDTSVADVILSYRRTLVAGETLVCEIVGVPDAESKPGKIAVTLNLKDVSGGIVRTFKGTLDRMKLDELRFNVPVADVLDSHLLIPELIVDGRSFTGFTPVELRANYNGDNKWYKHPVRDLAKCNAALQITPLADGKVRIDGKLVSATPLQQVSLLDSGAEIWMDNSPAKFQESADRVVIKITAWAKPRAGIEFDGKIRIRNAGNLQCGTYMTGRDESRYISVKPDGWDLKGVFPSNMNSRRMIFSLDRASVENAEIDIQFGLKSPKFTTRVFDGTLKVKDIVAKNIYAVAGQGISNLIFHHNDQPQRIPVGSGKKEVNFSVISNPALPQSVYFIEAIDVNRKLFRSQPVTIYKKSGKQAQFTVFDFFAKKVQRVSCDEALLTPQKITISAEHGSAVKNSGGNQLNGLAGGLASLVNSMRYYAEGGYGNIAKTYLFKQSDDHNAAPEIVKDASGKWVWRFNGKQNVAFPTNTIYPYCGFEVKIAVTPAKVRGTQTLLSTSHAGFRLFLKKGVPGVTFYRANAAAKPMLNLMGKNKLEIGKPAEIVVRYDQKTMKILVNGVEEASAACSGYQLYPQSLSVGLDADGRGFKGDVSSLSIKPL